MKYIKIVLTCALLCLLQQASAAQLTSISLKHRSAEQLIPLIQPMVNDSVRLSGQGYKLFIKADSEQTELINSLIDELDIAPKSYQVYVRSVSQTSNKKADAQLDVELSNTNINVRAKHHSTARKDTDGLQQSVRATEGYPAYVQTGSFKPTAFRAYGVSQTQHLPVISGFYVIPQSRGEDQVMFSISQQKQQLKNGRIQQQSLSSQLLLPINQWTVIGESNRVQNQTRRNVLSTRETEQNGTLVEMKVVLIPSN